MKLVIGLVGEKGAGKQTFVNFLKEIASVHSVNMNVPRNDGNGQIASSPSTNAQGPRNDKGGLNIRQIRFSDILAQTLILWDLPISRVNLQKLAIMMNTTFGETALANAAKFSTDGDYADIIIFDGIRREAELNLVKGMKNHSLIYITANQKLRYQRLKKRSEKVGETGLTFEQFLAEENSKAESQIPNLGKKIDLKIQNNGTMDEFRKEVGDLYKKYIYGSPLSRG